MNFWGKPHREYLTFIEGFKIPSCFWHSRKRRLNSDIEVSSQSGSDKEKVRGVSKLLKPQLNTITFSQFKTHTTEPPHPPPCSYKCLRFCSSIHNYITILGSRRPKGYKGYSWLKDTFGQQRHGLHCTGMSF